MRATWFLILAACGDFELVPESDAPRPSSNAHLRIDPPVTQLPATPVGSTSTTFLTVRNDGTEPGDLLDLDGVEAFEVRLPPVPFTLEPGQSVFVAVRYSPTESGDARDFVTVVGDAPPTDAPAVIAGRGFEIGDGVGAIEGWVCAPNGDTPVVGARVEVIEHPGVSGTTGPEGTFLLTEVPSGPATVRVSRGSWSEDHSVVIESGVVTRLSDGVCLSDDDVRVGVVYGVYDSIQVLLDGLGIDWRFVDLEYLGRPSVLDELDVLFVNCGTYGFDRAALANWVLGGGRLYASDWEFFSALAGAPEAFDDYDTGYTGDSGVRTGVVDDPLMRLALGFDHAQIRYDYGAWIELRGSDLAQVLVRDSVHGAPLMVAFEPGTGRVIYTTFHNSHQLTADVRVLLEEVILGL